MANTNYQRFIILAACYYLLFWLCYEFYIVNAAFFMEYLEASTLVATLILERLSYSVLNEALLDHILIIKSTNNSAVIHVGRGCDGSITFAVLLATIMAWNSKWHYRLTGFILGACLMFLLNCTRIAGLFIVELNAPEQFDFYHEWIFPTGLVISALAYFTLWLIFTEKRQ